MAGISAPPTTMSPVHRPGNGPAFPAGLIPAPVMPYSNLVQRPVHVTPALGGYPHAHQAASFGREQGRADSYGSEGWGSSPSERAQVTGQAR